MESLPDDVLVGIGLFLTDLRDFVHLSMASRRLRALLVESEATVAEVIRLRTGRSSSIPGTIRTLQELGLYEHILSWFE